MAGVALQGILWADGEEQGGWRRHIYFLQEMSASGVPFPTVSPQIISQWLLQEVSAPWQGTNVPVILHRPHLRGDFRLRAPRAGTPAPHDRPAPWHRWLLGPSTAQKGSLS